MKQRSKVILGIITGSIVVLLIIWVSPVGRFIQEGGLGMKEQPFDPQPWKAVESSVPSDMKIRLMMLEDLMQNHLKKGIDSMAVKEMLGEPDRKYGFSYSLGQLTSGIDQLYLIVKFDTIGKMEKLVVENEGKLKK